MKKKSLNKFKYRIYRPDIEGSSKSGHNALYLLGDQNEVLLPGITNDEENKLKEATIIYSPLNNAVWDQDWPIKNLLKEYFPIKGLKEEEAFSFAVKTFFSALEKKLLKASSFEELKSAKKRIALFIEEHLGEFNQSDLLIIHSKYENHILNPGKQKGESIFSILEKKDKIDFFG